MNPRLVKKVKVDEPILPAAQANVAEESILSAIMKAKKGVIRHQSKVEKYKRRLSYYESQLAAINLFNRTTQGSDNAVCNDPENLVPARNLVGSVHNMVDDDEKGGSQTEAGCRSQPVIPAADARIARSLKMTRSEEQESDDAGWGTTALPALQGGSSTEKQNLAARYPPCSKKESSCIECRMRKRNLETLEQKNVISLIRSSSSPQRVQFQRSSYFSSKHKRKIRSLILNPVNDQMFATSALNGIVNLWEVKAEGSQVCLLDSIDCLSLKERRWPEDIAWHPSGKSVHAVYSSDGGAAQASILNLHSSQQERVVFLEEKPHSKGIINSIVFMPWDDQCFATGGSDHAVILWSPKHMGNSWKTKVLHQNLHSSAVMGVVGMQGKHMILSTGKDKKIVGFDVLAGRGRTICQLENKCMRILPSPCDFNLFMVQTGTHEKQLRLFDFRQSNKEVHAFGWNQESSSLQSALISQAWSPNGMYITSGSPDPKIHIFDIRFYGGAPSQCLKVHQKRVFKAAWLQCFPLLVSTSSDLSIGLHRIA